MDLRFELDQRCERFRARMQARREFSMTGMVTRSRTSEWRTARHLRIVEEARRRKAWRPPNSWSCPSGARGCRRRHNCHVIGHFVELTPSVILLIQRERERARERERERAKERDQNKESERERPKQRERESERERETMREQDRAREYIFVCRMLCFFFPGFPGCSPMSSITRTTSGG